MIWFIITMFQWCFLFSAHFQSFPTSYPLEKSHFQPMLQNRFFNYVIKHKSTIMHWINKDSTSKHSLRYLCNIPSSIFMKFKRWRFFHSSHQLHHTENLWPWTDYWPLNSQSKFYWKQDKNKWEIKKNTTKKEETFTNYNNSQKTKFDRKKQTIYRKVTKS